MEFRFTIEQLPEIVKQFWDSYGNRKVFALKGAMGAGKTTFVHALCDLLGVADPVSSPTFSIINQYQTADGKDFYHVDLYRLKYPEEARSVGMEALLDESGICCIEWPELIKDMLPEDTCRIEIKAVSDNERVLIIQ